MKSIKLEVLENYNEINWDAKFLAIFSCRLESISVYEYERIDHDTSSEVMKGKQIFGFFSH